MKRLRLTLLLLMLLLMMTPVHRPEIRWKRSP